MPGWPRITRRSTSTASRFSTSPHHRTDHDVRGRSPARHALAHTGIQQSHSYDCWMREPNRRQVLATGLAAAAALLLPVRAGADPVRRAASALAPLGPEFVWGVATSGFQTEGHAPDSNWTRYIATGAAEPYRDSVRFLDTYADDIERAAQLGAKSFRMSIEWARVQPHPDEWDEQA